MDFARAELGVKEVPGERSNPRIVEYFSHTRLGGSAISDSTPWCSAFANFVMDAAGYRGTHRANARSWLEWGEQLNEPRLGCICVLWRESPQSAAGHVGFLTMALPHRLVLLGGNQSDGVSIREYGTSRLLGYRWPREADRK